MNNKVLFCASTFSHIKNFHMPYLQYFMESGWDVHIAAAGENKISEANACFTIPFRKNIFSVKNITVGFKLSKLIDREKYRLVITNSPLAGFLTRFFASKNGHIKYIHISHGYFFSSSNHGIKENLYRICEQLCASKTDVLLVMNNNDYCSAKKYNLCRNIIKIPGMGINCDKFHFITPSEKADARQLLNISPNSFVFIYPAEFSKRKNHEYLFTSFAEAVKKNSNLILITPGEGIMGERCKKLVKSMGLERNVVFPGHVSNIIKYYAASNCSISTSISEGLPFNIMEAMACGLPVICTNVPGHIDLIDEGKGGFVVALGNQQAFTSAILKIATNNDYCHEFGTYNREKVMSYDLKFAFDTIVSIYKRYMFQ